MNKLPDNSRADVVQLTIRIDKLRALFAQGALCVADIEMVNPKTKKLLWDLCLESCAGNTLCQRSVLEDEVGSESGRMSHPTVIGRCGTTTCPNKPPNDS